ncbi:PAS domain S-box-containing protein [Sporomusaceae bacterium BoRhaA]|uniref:PAS domain-containing sensor histidine kinase n=1 Tax=Pelorhabdus rhamnosifermentans TaxID=2772457 RepID=UPI001C063F9D|nr:PAS domain-containing sensor histidine kinase [Pelorhabdus rhamnosifermentans]MBU2699860.1 PAS domain S-box-containing protein [Pelorhabdus rhamnosifermentans]
MTLLFISFFLSAFGLSVMFLVYAYIYTRYKEQYMALWAGSILTCLLQTLLDLLMLSGSISLLVLLCYQLLSIGSSLLLVWGTCVFVGRQIPKWWLGAAILCTVVSNCGVLLGWPFTIYALPTSTFYGSTYIWTGFILYKYLYISHLVRCITVIPFILLGLHHFDFPFLRTIEWLSPWAYALDAILRVSIGICMLMMYSQQVRELLLESEKNLYLLAENARAIIYRFCLYPVRHFDYVSPSLINITGFTPREFYDNPVLPLQLIHPDDKPLFKKFIRSFVSPTQSLAIRILCKDHSVKWVELQNVTITNNDGMVTSLEGIARDITNRKHLEKEMCRLEGLHIVGQMAANLAHEIRNPLTTIRGYLQLMYKKQFKRDQERTLMMLQEVDRINTIITEYLALCKDKRVSLKKQQLNTILTQLYPLILADAKSLNQNVILELGLLPPILIDENEIRQLLINLVRNGLEAMQPNQTLTIYTYMQDDYAILAVQDQGTGIPSDILDEIGTPFFTTKECGTGLGLSVCYTIIERHQASLYIDSSPSGSIFYVQFNIAQS